MNNLHSNIQTLFVWVVCPIAGAGLFALFKSGRITAAAGVVFGLALGAAFVFADVAQVKSLGAAMWSLVSGFLTTKAG